MVLSGTGGGSLGVDERLTEVDRLGQGVLVDAFCEPGRYLAPGGVAEPAFGGGFLAGAT